MEDLPDRIELVLRSVDKLMNRLYDGDVDNEEIRNVHSQVNEIIAFLNQSGGKSICCDNCGRLYGKRYGFPDLIIDDEAWKAISVYKSSMGFLCPSCMCQLAHKHEITSVARFVSGPFRESDRTGLNTNLF